MVQDELFMEILLFLRLKLCLERYGLYYMGIVKTAYREYPKTFNVGLKDVIQNLVCQKEMTIVYWNQFQSFLGNLFML